VDLNVLFPNSNGNAEIAHLFNNLFVHFYMKCPNCNKAFFPLTVRRRFTCTRCLSPLECDFILYFLVAFILSFVATFFVDALVKGFWQNFLASAVVWFCIFYFVFMFCNPVVVDKERSENKDE